MSEYTNYCAVLTDLDAAALKAKLQDAKIASVIINDLALAGDGPMRWVPVATPGIVENGAYVDQWPALAALFGKALLLFTDENYSDWSIEISEPGKERQAFRFAGNAPLSDSARSAAVQALAAFFGVSPDSIAALLQPGQFIGFYDAVHVAYLELLDQSHLRHADLPSRGYAVLSVEMD